MIKLSKVRNTCDDVYVCWGRTEFADFAKDTDEVIYKLLNTDFEVTINGVQAEVRECRVSAIPFNRPWPGKQRAYNQSESAGFISFSADEEVEIRVKRKEEFETAIIRPLSKNVNVDICSGEVVFKLAEHGSYVLEFGDTHNVLHIFFNEIKEYPDARKATWYFGPGIHFPGVISLRDNDIVYVDDNAVVFGSINSTGAKNVKIFGGGVIDNSCEERLIENCYENFTKGTFRIYNCENIDVSDVILTNSSTWVMSMFDCKNIHINNVKIVGHWRYNTDGIDVVNSENVTIENCFIRSFDDTISIKAIYDYKKAIQNIMVDNCVMWCGWSKCCEIGIETHCTEYKNIVFKNCDLIHNSLAAMSISNGCGADIHNIVFENINVEFQNNTLFQVVQTEERQEYNSNGKTMAPCLIMNSNNPYSIRIKNPDGLKRTEGLEYGKIHDVTYRNIRIIADDKTIQPRIRIESHSENVVFENFEFKDVYINGKKANDFKEFETFFNNTSNVTLK